MCTLCGITVEVFGEMASPWESVSCRRAAVRWRRELRCARTFSGAPTTASSWQCLRHWPRRVAGSFSTSHCSEPQRCLCHFDLRVLRVDVRRGTFRPGPEPTVFQMGFSTFRAATSFIERLLVPRRRKTGTRLSFLCQMFPQLLRGRFIGSDLLLVRPTVSQNLIWSK